MEESHLLACIRQIEMNRVRFGLVDAPDKGPRSSALRPISRHGDGFVDPGPLMAMVEEDLKSFLTKTFERALLRLSGR